MEENNSSDEALKGKYQGNPIKVSYQAKP